MSQVTDLQRVLKELGGRLGGRWVLVGLYLESGVDSFVLKALRELCQALVTEIDRTALKRRFKDSVRKMGL